MRHRDAEEQRKRREVESREQILPFSPASSPPLLFSASLRLGVESTGAEQVAAAMPEHGSG